MAELVPKFEEFTEQYRESIYRFFVSRTRDTTLSEDLTQETFMKAWRNWPPSHFRTLKGWIFTIASNSLRDYARHQKVQSKYQDHLKAEVISRQDSVDVMCTQIQVRELLDLLDTESREILVLREVDHFTIEEIMEHLNLSRDRVRYRLKKSREKFVRLYNRKGI